MQLIPGLCFKILSSQTFIHDNNYLGVLTDIQLFICISYWKQNYTAKNI